MWKDRQRLILIVILLVAAAFFGTNQEEVTGKLTFETIDVDVLDPGTYDNKGKIVPPPTENVRPPPPISDFVPYCEDFKVLTSSGLSPDINGRNVVYGVGTSTGSIIKVTDLGSNTIFGDGDDGTTNIITSQNPVNTYNSFPQIFDSSIVWRSFASVAASTDSVGYYSLGADGVFGGTGANSDSGPITVYVVSRSQAYISEGPFINENIVTFTTTNVQTSQQQYHYCFTDITIGPGSCQAAQPLVLTTQDRFTKFNLRGHGNSQNAKFFWQGIQGITLKDATGERDFYSRSGSSTELEFELNIPEGFVLFTDFPVSGILSIKHSLPFVGAPFLITDTPLRTESNKHPKIAHSLNDKGTMFVVWLYFAANVTELKVAALIPGTNGAEYVIRVPIPAPLDRDTLLHSIDDNTLVLGKDAISGLYPIYITECRTP